MDVIAYYDGKVGQPDELVVPFNDRSHFFGDGVYDAAMAANGRIFMLDQHVDRFFNSAAMFDINIPATKDQVKELLLGLLAQVEGPSHFVYWQVTRGVQPRGHAYDPAIQGKLWAYIVPDPMADPSEPLQLITMEDHRFEYCNAKTLNLMPAVQYAQAAQMAGVYETVLHRNGVVTECAHSNVVILKGGVLHSHPNDEYILPGTAKANLIDACHKAGVPVVEEPFTLDELMDADEVIVTASSHLCTFVNQIDGKPVGGKDPETLACISKVAYASYLEYMGLDELPTTL